MSGQRGSMSQVRRQQWQLCINVRSRAVAGRLGLALVEERVLSNFPDEPHGIFRIGREEWAASPLSRGRDGTGPLL